MPHSGTCLCGKCAITISSTHTSLATCHCTDCQQWTGASNVIHIEPLREDVKLEGPIKEFSYTSDLGRVNKRIFCENCGSCIAQASDEWGGGIDIQAGNIPDCRDMPCNREIYCRSKFKSLPAIQGVAQFWADKIKLTGSNDEAKDAGDSQEPFASTGGGTLAGNCLCGQCIVKIAAPKPGTSLNACHCDSCQHFTGSSNSIYLKCTSKDLHILGGPLREFRHVSSATFVSCDACGSSMFRTDPTAEGLEPKSDNDVALFCGSFVGFRGYPVSAEHFVETRFAALSAIPDAKQLESK